jgi:YesN/AraC family two-component response regulator
VEKDGNSYTLELEPKNFQKGFFARRSKIMAQTEKPRVLIADDEKYIRGFLRVLISRMDCEVAGEATNGQEAIELFKEEKPDLLLLDINMPFKTGEEALQEIMSQFPDAFVIMLTSVVDLESVKKCIDLGAANYILKNTPVKDIIRIVKETWQTFQQKKGENPNA